MAEDCKRASATVKYLVYSTIFFLPSSPSCCNSSSAGIAIVKSWIMIELVIYGVMLSASTLRLSNEPPVIALKNPNASPVCFAKKSLK